jgi:hypothetical protein
LAREDLAELAEQEAPVPAAGLVVAEGALVQAAVALELGLELA